MFKDTYPMPMVPYEPTDAMMTTSRSPRKYKCGLASDLHMDFALLNDEFFGWRGDVLLLAGDLAEEDFLRSEKCLPFWERVSEMAPVVLCNLGNHEFYRSEIDRALTHMREHTQRWTNITFLENETFELDGMVVFGATYWTNFDNNPTAEFGAGLVLNDYRQIRVANSGYRPLKVVETKGMNLRSRFMLEQTLARNLPTLVMTHHAPSLLSTHPKYKDDFEMNLAYCNRDEDLILRNPNIKAWVHGHTHWKWDYEIGNTRVLCNARGYPGERPTFLPAYQPLEFILEV